MNVTLFNADTLAALIFLCMASITVFGALAAVLAKRLVRAVAGLALSFVGVAGIYYFLNSPFVSMMQLLIYVGAICVTISFAIMLAEPEQTRKESSPTLFGIACGGLTAIFLTIAFILTALHTNWPVHAKVNMGDVETIGIQLLTNFSMVFELVSIVLLVAIIGALVIAREGRD